MLEDDDRPEVQEAKRALLEWWGKLQDAGYSKEQILKLTSDLWEKV